MMEQYVDRSFQSSTTLTPEFQQFADDFKKELIRQLPDPYVIIDYSIGHFYVSGFISTKWCEQCSEKNIPEECPNYMKKMVGACKGPAYIYFSISDVRHFKNKWYDKILIRTAKSPKDYTGGSNGYTRLEDFGKKAKRLMDWQLGK